MPERIRFRETVNNNITFKTTSGMLEYYASRNGSDEYAVCALDYYSKVDENNGNNRSILAFTKTESNRKYVPKSENLEKLFIWSINYKNRNFIGSAECIHENRKKSKSNG